MVLFSVFQPVYSNDVQLIFSSFTFKVIMCFLVAEQIYLSCFNGNVWQNSQIGKIARLLIVHSVPAVKSY